MKNISLVQLSLWMNLAPDAPEGPGWYIGGAGVGVNGDNQIFIPLSRVAPATAATLGVAFDDALQGTPKSHTVPNISPSQLVASGSNLIRAALQAQLDEAEEQAKKVKRLRLLLQNETPVTVSTVTNQE